MAEREATIRLVGTGGSKLFRRIAPATGRRARNVAPPSAPSSSVSSPPDRGPGARRRIAVEYGFPDGFGCARPGVRDDELQHCPAVGLFGGGAQQGAAALGEFHRIAQNVQQDLPQPPLIGGDDRRKTGIDDHRQLQSLFCGLRREKLHGGPGQPRRVEIRGLQRHALGLQLGDVQNIIDQIEQVLAGFAYRGGVFLLVRLQAAAFQQLRHAQYAVQRRAQLMRDGRQEQARGAPGVRVPDFLILIPVRQRRSVP